MKINKMVIFQKKIKREGRKLHYLDIWNIVEIKRREFFNGKDKKKFICNVYLCFLKRYPTEEEYAVILDNLKHKKCRLTDVIYMVQEFEEAKQYPMIQVIK